jgi:hypothetical protein
MAMIFVLGVIVGAGAMYLGFKQPWQHRNSVATTTIDAGVPTPIDAASVASKKRKGRATTQDGANQRTTGETNDVVDETGPTVLSAADRAVIWQGPEIAIPTKKIDLSNGGDEARSLSQSEISSGLQSVRVLDCIVQAATGTDIAATVTLKLLVNGAGSVTKHRIAAPKYLLEHGLSACAARAIGKASFASTGGWTLVTVPFDIH